MTKAGEPKTEPGATVALSPSAKTGTNKRTFGTDLTNTNMNRSNLDSTIQKKSRLTHSGSDILKRCKLSVQSRLEQGNRSDFVYGPFHPARARKQELDGANKSGQRKMAEDWESLSASFRPQYQNQGKFKTSQFLLWFLGDYS
jgi:transcription factor E2F7/8